MSAGSQPRRIVQVSCETTALTTLPDALLDDEAISPMAKMAYWYLKRHGGFVGNGDRVCREVAEALQTDYEYAWLVLAELRDLGWLTVSYSGAEIRFTVHEMAVTVR